MRLRLEKVDGYLKRGTRRSHLEGQVALRESTLMPEGILGKHRPLIQRQLRKVHGEFCCCFLFFFFFLIFTAMPVAYGGSEARG